MLEDNGNSNFLKRFVLVIDEFLETGDPFFRGVKATHRSEQRSGTYCDEH